MHHSHWSAYLVSIIKTPRLTIDRLDELFIKFWTLEGAVTERGAAITIWRLKPIDQLNRFNYGRSHYSMAFYCQWPIKSFSENSVSLAFASNFCVDNSSRHSSRCLDDRDYRMPSSHSTNTASTPSITRHVKVWVRWDLKRSSVRLLNRLNG